MVTTFKSLDLNYRHINSSLFVILLFLSQYSFGQNRPTGIDTLLLKKIETNFQQDKIVNLGFHFGFNCFSNIQDSENQQILNTILFYLQNNTDISMKLVSHTDCRGDEQFNKDLSQRIADLTRSWLKKNGISPTRLISIGKGEYEPLIKCVNCDCDQEIHEKNRRFEIIKVN